MRWIDLLRMSSGNLKRRKLRTFLTILGVVIGTASIVVMISLGLGMQEAMYREVEQSGGMTNLTVTGTGTEGVGSMSSTSDSNAQKTKEKYITDDVLGELQKLDKVKSVNPVLELSAVALKGNYLGYIQLRGMTTEALKERNIKLASGGRLPDPNSSNLELVFGNGVLTSFFEKTTNKGYWETGELPDIDLATDQMFLVLDQNAYFETQSQSGGMPTTETNENQTVTKPPKKHVVKACGVVDGGIDSYNANFYSVYCDIEKLQDMLKKEYRGRVIPGQPTTKSGKPYKKFVYSSVSVQVENMEDVEPLSSVIRSMGYEVTTNAEYIESMKKQFAMIQAVLGGIGAVSLFVAAIGIANTMMMSIYERTKEIGVIKVLGCGLQNIQQMFLLEAAFIGLIGGVVGNILSFLMSIVINWLTGAGNAMGFEGNISYIPLWLVLVSMIFAVFVGMAAGFFPALRAMRLSPLAAIRND